MEDIKLNETEIVIHCERLNPNEPHLLLEIKNNKAKFYDLNSKIMKEADVSNKEIENFIYVAETIGFFDLDEEKTYGVNLNIGEGQLDKSQSEWVSIKKGDSKIKTVCALFSGSHTPSVYNTMVWEAIRFGQAKSK